MSDLLLIGHTSFVNDAVWVAGGNQVLSGGSDGSVRLWDATTTVRINSLANIIHCINLQLPIYF